MKKEQRIQKKSIFCLLEGGGGYIRYNDLVITSDDESGQYYYMVSPHAYCVQKPEGEYCVEIVNVGTCFVVEAISEKALFLDAHLIEKHWIACNLEGTIIPYKTIQSPHDIWYALWCLHRQLVLSPDETFYQQELLEQFEKVVISYIGDLSLSACQEGIEECMSLFVEFQAYEELDDDIPHFSASESSDYIRTSERFLSLDEKTLIERDAAMQQAWSLQEAIDIASAFINGNRSGVFLSLSATDQKFYALCARLIDDIWDVLITQCIISPYSFWNKDVSNGFRLVIMQNLYENEMFDELEKIKNGFKKRWQKISDLYRIYEKYEGV
jgi:hypothetical protein